MKEPSIDYSSLYAIVKLLGLSGVINLFIPDISNPYKRRRDLSDRVQLKGALAGQGLLYALYGNGRSFLERIKATHMCLREPITLRRIIKS